MKSILFILFALCIIFVSCTSGTKEQTVENKDLIEVTKAQFESEKMVFGNPAYQPFSNQVYFTGTIVPGVNGQAQISLSVPGRISKIFCRPGQLLEKNSVMFEVSGNEFIDLQRDLAESAAKLSGFLSDYSRTKELYEDSISTQKEYNLAERNYFAENAKYNALKIKIESMALNVSKIEKGEFYSSYFLKSPIKGFVANLNVTIGQYIEPQQKIAEIINSDTYQLRLSVFEKNIDKIKINQPVDFYLNGNKAERYKAKIISVGNAIPEDSKSIDCFAKIENSGEINMVSNQFVEGEIYISVDSALSVPEAAIMKSDEDMYLLRYEYLKDSIYYFRKVKVTTRRRNKGYVELEEVNPSSKIVVDGIYNIGLE